MPLSSSRADQVKQIPLKGCFIRQSCLSTGHLPPFQGLRQISAQLQVILALLQHPLPSHLPLVLNHISHFRRQHERTPVIPPVEVRHHLRRLGWLVFVYEMACVGEDGKLIFSW